MHYNVFAPVFFHGFLPRLLVVGLPALGGFKFDAQGGIAVAREQQDGVRHARHRALGFEDCSRHLVPPAAVRHAEKDGTVFRVLQAEPSDAVPLDGAFLVFHGFVVGGLKRARNRTG